MQVESEHMWTTVVVLAIAVNFEPFRIWLVPFLMMRPRPIAQLLAFLASSVLMSTAVGLLVLFVLQDPRLGVRNIDAGVAKIVIGLLVVLIAAWLGMNRSTSWLSGRKAVTQRGTTDDGTEVRGDPTSPPATSSIATRAQTLALQGSSPWVSGAIGLATAAIPSADYLAMLFFIAASAATPLTQAAALVTFVGLANAVVAIPIVSSLIAPERTRAALAKFHAWVLSRSRREVAAILALVGGVLIAAGISSL